MAQQGVRNGSGARFRGRGGGSAPDVGGPGTQRVRGGPGVGGTRLHEVLVAAPALEERALFDELRRLPASRAVEVRMAHEAAPRVTVERPDEHVRQSPFRNRAAPFRAGAPEPASGTLDVSSRRLDAKSAGRAS